MYYFDYAASFPNSKKALEYFVSVQQQYFANPSAPHDLGKQAKTFLEKCRTDIAQAFECSAQHLTFCSSASEANNLLLSSFINKSVQHQILVANIEHSSVASPIHNLAKYGFKIKQINVLKNGVVDLKSLEKLLQTPTSLVAVMTVNNEYGTIQPIAEIATLVAEHRKNIYHGIHFHSDMVQALGKISLPLALVDSATFSSHKIDAMRGCGILYCRKEIMPLYSGGGQEKGLRPGTESVAHIASFAHGIEHLDLTKSEHRVRSLYQYLLEKLPADKFTLYPLHRKSHEALYVPHIVSVAVKNIPGEVTMRLLSAENIFVGTGSSCHTNNKKSKNNYLQLNENEANTLIRISLSSMTTEKEIDMLVLSLTNIAQKYAPSPRS